MPRMGDVVTRCRWCNVLKITDIIKPGKVNPKSLAHPTSSRRRNIVTDYMTYEGDLRAVACAFID